LERKALDSCGMYELSETPQVGTTEEAHGRARGKRSDWSANQQPSLTQAKIIEFNHLNSNTDLPTEVIKCNCLHKQAIAGVVQQ
jgi:hypothetical protein